MPGTNGKELPLFGQRHVLVLCANLGFAIIYCMRVNLSVALVAMVNASEPHVSNSSLQNASFALDDQHDDDHCPHPSEVANVSAPAALDVVGPQFPLPRHIQGIVLSSFFWGSVVLQIPAGTLAQKYGAKWIFGLGVSWMSILSILTPLVVRLSILLLIPVRVLQGIGDSVTAPAMIAMLGRWAPPQETSRLISVAMLGTGIGMIVGQATAGPLCSSVLFGGWPSVFYVSGAAGLVWLVPWGFFVSDSPSNHPRISGEERDYIIEAIGTDQHEANVGALPWRQILLSGPVWVYIIISIAGNWIAFTLMACLPQYLSDVLHFDISSNGLVASLPCFGYILTANVYTWACDAMIVRRCLSKTNARKLFSVIATWGIGGCLLAISFFKCDRVAIVALLVIGAMLYSANYAGYYSNPLDLSPEYSGTIFGISNTLSTLSGVAAPVVTDAIAADGTIAQWSAVFYISSLAAAGSGLLYLLLGSSDPDRRSCGALYRCLHKKKPRVKRLEQRRLMKLNLSGRSNGDADTTLI